MNILPQRYIVLLAYKWKVMLVLEGGGGTYDMQYTHTHTYTETLIKLKTERVSTPTKDSARKAASTIEA